MIAGRKQPQDAERTQCCEANKEKEPVLLDTPLVKETGRTENSII